MRYTVLVTARFPLDLEARTRLTAARLRISLAELVRRAIEDYLQSLAANDKPQSDRPASIQPQTPVARSFEEDNRKQMRQGIILQRWQIIIGMIGIVFSCVTGVGWALFQL